MLIRNQRSAINTEQADQASEIAPSIVGRVDLCIICYAANFCLGVV